MAENRDKTPDCKLAFHEEADSLPYRADYSKESDWRQHYRIDKRYAMNVAVTQSLPSSNHHHEQIPSHPTFMKSEEEERTSPFAQSSGPEHPDEEEEEKVLEEPTSPENLIYRTENVRTSSTEDDMMNLSQGGDKETLQNRNTGEQTNDEHGVKSLNDSDDEGRELDEIKDQVRMLQQQQMYQVQMLNFLHLQLTVIASNPQAATRNQPPIFPSSGMPGVNGFQLQNMQQLLAAAASMSGTHTPGNNLLPSVAAAIGRHFNANNTSVEKLSETVSQLPKAKDLEMEMNEALQQESRTKNGEEENAFYGGRIGNPQEPPLYRNCSGMNSDPNQPGGGYGTAEESLSRRSCRFCQKVFGSESALQIHLRSHTGERPFKCNICANRFSTKGNLKVHFSRHQEKYPHIEMNANPIPEYLDNVPTSSGIPYGMSIIPDFTEVPDPDTALPVPVPDKHIPPPLIHKSDILPALYRPIETQSSVNTNATKDLSHQDTTSNTNDRQASFDQPKEERSNNDDQSAGFPYIQHGSKSSSDMENQYNSSRILHQSSSPPSFALPRHMSEGSRPTYDEEPSKRQNAPSETSKLQQLVDQIDKGKELEKNECHICHRVLSCQSALKLHYRTHTGERPYKCDLCSRAFTTRGNLRTHYSSVHRQQLRSSPPTNPSVMRGVSLQCPLCGSRFMDQQSMRQHMQMHLYMHSQQQQQVAHFLHGRHSEGQIPLAFGGKFPPSIGENDIRMPDQITEIENQPLNRGADTSEPSDDVFEERSPDRETFSEPDDRVVPVGSPHLRHESEERVNREQEPSSLSPPDGKGSERLPLPGTSDSIVTKPLTSGISALDLTRSNSNSPGVITSSMYSNAGMMGHDNHRPSSQSPPQLASNSLNALAHLASNSAIMRPSGMPLMNVRNPLEGEMRARKMTTSCEICNKPFTCQSALEIHLRIHTKERPYLCRVCERGFTTKGNLKQHLLTHNINEVDDDLLEPVETSPITANSNSNSPVNSPATIVNSNQQALQRKRPSESSDGQSTAKRTYPRHWCHICQKQFSSASSLQIHNRTHTGEKPFACSVCGRAFTTKGNLKVHMGTHVWGAGGSRRGRRISMDNPLISPWMQNTSNSSSNPPSQAIRPRPAAPPIPAVPDPALIYQQYAALASGLIGAKASAESRFHANGMLNLHNAAAARLLLPHPNGHVPPSSVGAQMGHHVPTAGEHVKGNERSNNIAAASEWIWKAYQRTQEQVN
uniref:sal-like protein 3 isoform X2 n=1 Tax=Ciona intestinalis TaxID=7719 RepID=UPI000EF489F0|nr:sal-like protein 3 isoform X2 [Ciona intestinalis]|eukprot:XP_026689824.1 sal-like protein 3 isoform X2 [Ciona intestinalis]